jgi:hypothetical protein
LLDEIGEKAAPCPGWWELERGEAIMALFELRTYTLNVGALGEVTRLYQEEGWAAVENGGFSDKLVGYFTADAGQLNQLVHLWKFDDDADRRSHWDTMRTDAAFLAFAMQLRPHIQKQENQLLLQAPWGPHP